MRIGILLLSIFIVLSAFHFYWAAGGQRGVKGVFPTKENGEHIFRSHEDGTSRPGIVATLVVATLLLACAMIIAIRSQLILDLDPNHPVYNLSKWGSWAIATVFFLRCIGDFRYVGFFKNVKGTYFAELDTTLFSPLCLIIAILSVWVARRGM
ncbi:MAG: DUF3995 domain-containing protein [Bacteroidetes bacterium]|nr:DUF3995 domain-containing protein [Bacteroidota bacterium]